MENELIESAKSSIQELIKKPQNKKVQYRAFRIQKYINLCHEFKKEVYLEPILTTLPCLLQEKPNYKYIDSILDEYAPLVNERNHLYNSMFSNNPFKHAFFGILLGTYVAIFLLSILASFPKEGSIFGSQTQLILISMFAGSIGGAASVISRLLKIDPNAKFDASFVLYTAISKPLLGLIYGIASLFLLKCGIININLQNINEIFLIGSIAFVAGMSEKFVEDIIGKLKK